MYEVTLGSALAGLLKLSAAISSAEARAPATCYEQYPKTCCDVSYKRSPQGSSSNAQRFWFESNGNTIVRADVNGNATADVTIVLAGINHNLVASDFIL